MATLTRKTSVRVRVKNVNGILQNQAPITIKGTTKGIRSISDIGNVDVIDLVDGATLVYNSSTNRYEIRKLPIEKLDGNFNLDDGEF